MCVAEWILMAKAEVLIVRFLSRFARSTHFGYFLICLSTIAAKL